MQRGAKPTVQVRSVARCDVDRLPSELPSSDCRHWAIASAAWCANFRLASIIDLEIGHGDRRRDRAGRCRVTHPGHERFDVRVECDRHPCGSR